MWNFVLAMSALDYQSRDKGCKRGPPEGLGYTFGGSSQRRTAETNETELP
jgi:hypothetical protein